MARAQQLTQLLQPLVEQLSYEFVGLEYQTGGHALLRVYIDRPEGITVDDCAGVSREISALMDVHDPIKSEYNLEVSSPGLDRPLFTIEQFASFVGQQAQLTVAAPVAGRRKFKGPIVRAQGDVLLIDQDGEQVEIEHNNVMKARLVPEI